MTTQGPNPAETAIGSTAVKERAAGDQRRNGKKNGKKALSEGKRAERRLAWLLCAPAVIVMVAVTAWPIIYSVWLSLQRYDLRFPDDTEFVGLDNYVAVLSSGYWWTALGMTLALVMHRALVGRGLVRTVSLIPYGIVTVVAAFSWYFAWDQVYGYFTGPDDAPLTQTIPSLLIIVLAEVWKTTPFMALL